MLAVDGDPWSWRIALSGMFPSDPEVIDGWPMRTKLQALAVLDVRDRKAKEEKDEADRKRAEAEAAARAGKMR